MGSRFYAPAGGGFWVLRPTGSPLRYAGTPFYAINDGFRGPEGPRALRLAGARGSISFFASPAFTQQMEARAAEHARVVASLQSTIDALAAGNPQRRLEMPIRFDLAPMALQA